MFVMPSSGPVPTPLLQPYPLRSGARRPQWVEDALGLANNGKQAAVDQIVDMLTDLHQEGRNSRYVKSLTGLPLYELKSTSRGGHKGGARVYFAFTEHGEALILNAETKPQGVDAPNPAKIAQALQMLAAYQKGELEIARNTTSINPKWW